MGTINVIVENVDTDTIDEEETTVVIQADDDLMGDELPPALTELKVPDENKGHLVEQILKQIEEEGEDTKNKVDIDWEEDGRFIFSIIIKVAKVKIHNEQYRCEVTAYNKFIINYKNIK